MLAQLNALYQAVTNPHGTGRCPIRAAWRQGGLARLLAVIVVFSALAAWLLLTNDPGAPSEQRISEFIGASGIVWMMVGNVAGLEGQFGKLRDGKDGPA